MNGGSIKSRQFYGSLEYAKLTLKYHSLLEDYLELQKEYVSKKKKLQVKKQKREILLDEVRFLRQRYKNLKKSQVAKVELELGPCQNANIHDVPIRKESNHIANETNIEQEGNGKEELVLMTQSIEKPMSFLISEKKRRKRKVSWQDLKV